MGYAENNKEKILFISSDTAEEKEVTKMLSATYEFIFAADTKTGFDILEKDYDGMTAVLINTRIAQLDEYAFLKKVRKTRRFAFIPVIAVLEDEPKPEDIAALEYGVIDFIYPPYHKEIIKNTILNAIRIKDSKTFDELEAMLKELPSNIYLKDSQCRYVFATHYWHHLEHDDDPNWTIRGKTDVEIRKDRENAIAAMEKDKEIIATGRGTSYVIELNTDGVREFLEIIKEPVRNSDGKISGIIALINDVTEQELLKERLRILSVTDGMTGLFNRREIQTRIDNELTSAKDKNFSLIMLDIDDFKQVNDIYGHREGDRVIIELAKILKDEKIVEVESFSAGSLCCFYIIPV